ncbi:hypothetical protein ElyMa_006470700 [Elysia marginata]|uniref:Uncharacterized protein n=1 Tax=Elysia marginata TaxID=1093978 RepID=A0AAV4I446_9GAST|nr:hypothetical protein ElyMa_006470700 [Elysia marginata]
MRYQVCKKDHDPRIRVGLSKGDRFLRKYSELYPCDLDEEPEIDVWASGGTLHLTTKSCLTTVVLTSASKLQLGMNFYWSFWICAFPHERTKQ